MRRPIRTRRLSIAAIVSLLAFGVAALVSVRSFWTWDQWVVGSQTRVGLDTGCFFYAHEKMTVNAPFFWHQTDDADPNSILDALPKIWKFAGFSAVDDIAFEIFILRVPLWFPLLLLLIAPVRWLIARPANAPAFPVNIERT